MIDRIYFFIYLIPHSLTIRLKLTHVAAVAWWCIAHLSYNFMNKRNYLFCLSLKLDLSWCNWQTKQNPLIHRFRIWINHLMMMTGDKIGNKRISPNKTFKLNESYDEQKDYGGSYSMKQYLLSWEQLSTTNGKTMLHLPSTAAAALSITHNSNNAPVNCNKLDESSTASAIPWKTAQKNCPPLRQLLQHLFFLLRA